MSVAYAPPPRWGPLPPQTWPQDENRVPNATGMRMPPVSIGNRLRSRRESFTMSGSITITSAAFTGQVLPLYLPTDQDGDFWCDQIYCCAWLPGSTTSIIRTLPATIGISDARTGRNLCYPAVPSNFFTTRIQFSDDAGFDPGAAALPNAWRSTSTLAQPFCFTRSGGISVAFTMLGSAATFGAQVEIVDFAFGGWKEYEAASA